MHIRLKKMDSRDEAEFRRTFWITARGQTRSRVCRCGWSVRIFSGKWVQVGSAQTDQERALRSN